MINTNNDSIKNNITSIRAFDQSEEAKQRSEDVQINSAEREQSEEILPLAIDLPIMPSAKSLQSPK